MGVNVAGSCGDTGRIQKARGEVWGGSTPATGEEEARPLLRKMIFCLK